MDREYDGVCITEERYKSQPEESKLEGGWNGEGLEQMNKHISIRLVATGET